MSLTINIYYTGKPGAARAFMNEMLSDGIVERIRAEKGNLQYEYFLPVDDSDTVLLIDKWADRRALDLHHASPMMARITALREKYDLKMRVEKYISDDAPATADDSKFIRQ